MITADVISKWKEKSALLRQSLSRGISRLSIIQGSCTSEKSGRIGKPYQVQGFSGKFRENQGSFCLEGDESGKMMEKIFSIIKNGFLEIILMSIFIAYFSYFQDFFHCAVIMTDGNGKYIIATLGSLFLFFLNSDCKV